MDKELNGRVEQIRAAESSLDIFLEIIQKHKPSWETKKAAVIYDDNAATWHRGMLTGWLLGSNSIPKSL